MEKLNVCGFSDILRFAENNFDGLYYNGVHELFVNEDICEGVVYVEDIVNDLENYKDTLTEDKITVYTIIKAFAEHHNVKEFHIAPKNW